MAKLEVMITLPARDSGTGSEPERSALPTPWVGLFTDELGVTIEKNEVLRDRR